MSIRSLSGGPRRQPSARNRTATPGAASGSANHPTHQPAPPPAPGQATATGSAAQQTAARLASVRQPGTALTAPLPNAQAVAPATTPAQHPPVQAALAFPRWAKQVDQTLQSLPHQMLYGSGNDTLIRRLEQQLMSLPSGDPLRIDIVRTATHFLHPNDQGQVDLARLKQLGRLAFGRADYPATNAQIRQALGTKDERVAALIDGMPRWAATLNDLDVQLMIRALPPTIMGRPHRLADALESFSTARHQLRDGHPLRLPRDNFWLDDPARQHQIIFNYTQEVDHFGPNRALSADLLRVASDLSPLPSTKHKLAAFLRRAFALDDARQHHALLHLHDLPPLFESADRRLILEALVRQLPHPGFGNPATQQDILQLVKLRFERDGMRLEDRRRLASCLQGITAALPSSRVHGPGDLQGSALKALSQALQNLPANDSSQLMNEMLDGHAALSTQRRPSALAPRHRSDMRRFMTAQSTTLFVPISVGTLMGRPSPADKSCEYVLRALRGKLPAGTSAYTASSMLPICQRLLSKPPRIDKTRAKQLTTDVSAILATGGLPFGLDPQAREQMLSLALGDQMSLRSGVARQLIGIAKAGDGHAKGQALNEQRIGAARYLHHLLATGSHGLDAEETAQAQAAIRQACTDVRPDKGSLPVVAALLAESATLADGAAALPTLVEKLGGGFKHLDNEAAQHVVAQLTPFYANLPASDQHALAQAVAERLPLPPAERDPQRTDDLQLRHALQAQDIGVALVGNLIRNENSQPGPLIRWAGEVFKRLNPINRSAALNIAFDGFAQASTAGRDTAIRFVDSLHDRSEFTTGAMKLVQNAFADEVADKLEPSVKAALVNSINRRLPELGPDDASALVGNSTTREVDLPPELMSGFIREVPKLDTPSLRQLLVTWESSLRQQTPELNHQQHQQWMDAARHSKSETADIVHAFMRVAAQAHPSQQLPPSKHQVTPEAAHHLASALPHMEAPTMQAAFTHIGQVSLPDEARAEVISAVFNQLRRFDLPEREKAIGLCLRLDRSRTLSTLAANFGMPMLGPMNRVDRLLVDQPIATLQGPPTTFAQQIAGMPGAQAGPILEVLAGHLFNAPAQQQQPMQQLIGQELPRLPERHQDRVRQTYLYSNRDWVDQLRDPDRGQDVTEVNRMRRHMRAAVVDSIRRLGEDPGSSTWQELLHTDRQRVPELLRTLRETRGQTHGAPTSREEVSVDEFFTPPGSPSQFGQAGPSRRV